MNNGKNFLSIKDLMQLMGTNNLSSAYKRHKAIREAIKPGKKSLLIIEYCTFEGLPFDPIWEIIRPGQLVD